MDPVTTVILGALLAGVAAGVTDVGKQAIVDAYGALKAVITGKYGQQGQLAEAISGLESKPESQGRQATLQEEVAEAGADRDIDVLVAVRALEEKLIQHGGERIQRMTHLPVGIDAAAASGVEMRPPVTEKETEVLAELSRKANEATDLEAVSQAFTITPSDGPAKPTEAHTFGMYLAGKWYRLALRDPAPADPVQRLDVSLLADRLVGPILKITDPRRDPRIDFVGGIRGMAELERRVDSGDWAAAFALFPTSLDDLMAVADAGQVMPPKSTWFEPKLADGMVSLVLD